MKILLAHNYYLQGGGEDTVFHAEAALLRSYDNEVIEYVEHNKKIQTMKRPLVALQTIWSQPSYENMKQLIQTERPAIAHFHNTFPLISPSAYYACHDMEIPVVQSLHNPRLLCPAATFYRDGHLCVDCLGKTPPWPAVLHACYRHSRSQTAIVVSMLTIHRWMKTWKNMVEAYIVFTDFYRTMFTQGGIPANKIYLKPHFVFTDSHSIDNSKTRTYALFVGRLDPEKGVWTLLEAWRKLNIPLKIRGSGQLDVKARDFVAQHGMNNVEFIDRLDETEMSNLMYNARFLVTPSEGYYETFGMVIIEAYARCVPVLASNTGVTPELVSDGKTGLLFEPGNGNDLAQKAKWLWDHPEQSADMGRNARKEYEQKYTPERNYEMLMKIYSRTIEARKNRR